MQNQIKPPAINDNASREELDAMFRDLMQQENDMEHHAVEYL